MGAAKGFDVNTLCARNHLIVVNLLWLGLRLVVHFILSVFLLEIFSYGEGAGDWLGAGRGGRIALQEVFDVHLCRVGFFFEKLSRVLIIG